MRQYSPYDKWLRYTEGPNSRLVNQIELSAILRNRVRMYGLQSVAHTSGLSKYAIRRALHPTKPVNAFDWLKVVLAVGCTWSIRPIEEGEKVSQETPLALRDTPPTPHTEITLYPLLSDI